jgi:hypothetical protein
MKLKLVKASQGLVWVRQGILACRQQPLGFIGLLGLFGCVALLLVGLPARIGAVLIVAAMPVMWMGFMLATRRVLTGQRITLSVMFEALKGPDAPRRAFATLGAVYVLVTLLMLQVAQWLGPDQDALDKLMSTADDATELLTNPLVQEDMMWRMLLTIPVSLVFWHTPALLLWARLPVAKALFFSAVATWRNIGAFIVYGMGWMGIMLSVALIDRLLLAIIPEPFFGNLVAIVASMWIASAFYASLYFTVVDCFEPQRQVEA